MGGCEERHFTIAPCPLQSRLRRARFDHPTVRQPHGNPSGMRPAEMPFMIRKASCLLALALVMPSCAGAALLASESFSYAPGALNGQTGGSGWTGAWVTGQATVFVVQASSLTSGAGGTGGSLQFDGS